VSSWGIIRPSKYLAEHAGCRLGGGMERAVGGMAGFRGAAAGCDRLGLGTDV